MGIRIIRQRIAAGGNFNGTLPPTTPPKGAKDIEKDYPVAATGGLFDFALTQPMELCQVEIILGGQSSWKIEKVDSDGTVFPIVTGTNETSYVRLPGSGVIITEGEVLKLTTVAASTAMRARMVLRDAR